MTSKLNPWRVCRNLCTRSRPALACTNERLAFSVARRGLADDTTIRPDNPDSSIPPPGSEEAAPRQYVRPPAELFVPNWLNAEALAALEQAAAGEDMIDEVPGHKFGMPTLPGKNDQLQNRYPPVIEQVTKLLMRDGKLSQAERNMSMILNFLRTSPAPKVNPLRPLLPGSPPAERLPLDPVLYLTLAIDSVAPLLRVRNMKGMAGGGMALELPEPLTARQRRRVAVLWILDVVNKKKSRGSGRTQFAARVAEEIVSVVEGKSVVWDRRQMVHKLGTSARANLNHPAIASKRGR
ncbi:ribosomal protein S7 domain-containing protein [Xylariales sp. AK1849]|nr:ribosomal protein S7 domain-containing protein [Xylariales sp. AK1849]